MGTETESTTKRLSRRDFLKFAMTVTTVLALPKHNAGKIATALAAGTRVPVVWLEFQDCTGDSESFLRAAQRTSVLDPGVTTPALDDILFDFISLEYHETLMAPSGFNAQKSLDDVMKNYPGQYVVIVEGSIPMANNGVYCTIGGRTALSIVQEVTAKAKATISVGSCSWDGGLAAAAPNPTGATGVKGAVPGIQNFVALPGCPANVVNITATIVHLLTFGTLPSRSADGRPYFAYGDTIHDECERKDFYENDQFVLAWDDAGARKGWCLYKMGCKGPVTHNNCSTVLWNEGTCWPVRAGHGCIGCAEPNFWDVMSPIYSPVPFTDD